MKPIIRDKREYRYNQFDGPQAMFASVRKCSVNAGETCRPKTIITNNHWHIHTHAAGHYLEM